MPLTPEHAHALRRLVAARVAAWAEAPDPAAIIDALSRESLSRLLAIPAGPTILHGLLDPEMAPFWRVGLVKVAFLSPREAAKLEAIEQTRPRREVLELGGDLPPVTVEDLLEALGMQTGDLGADPGPSKPTGAVPEDDFTVDIERT